MHTDMCSPQLSSTYVEKCRVLWWTVYVLERQMSSLMGIPMGITDECISTPIPSLPDEPQKSTAMEIQVKLAQALSKVDRSRLDQHTTHDSLLTSYALSGLWRGRQS